MLKSLTLLTAIGLCASAGVAHPDVLVLKSGQRIVYDQISRDGNTIFVRSGSESIVLDAAELQASPSVEPPREHPVFNVPGPAARLILPNAGKHNLRPELIQAVMEVESGYQVNARSRSGAIGLMQLMPGTARHLAVNPHDPEQNVEGGARLLDLLVTKYENRKNGLALALAAYNAGPGAVDRFGGIPPFHETRRYVTKVIARFRQLTGE